MDTTGRRLRRARRARGITQREMARRLGLTQQAVSDAERAAHTYVATVRAYCAAMGATVEEVIGGADADASRGAPE